MFGFASSASSAAADKTKGGDGAAAQPFGSFGKGFGAATASSGGFTFPKSDAQPGPADKSKAPTFAAAGAGDTASSNPFGMTRAAAEKMKSTIAPVPTFGTASEKKEAAASGHGGQKGVTPAGFGNGGFSGAAFPSAGTGAATTLTTAPPAFTGAGGAKSQQFGGGGGTAAKPAGVVSAAAALASAGLPKSFTLPASTSSAPLGGGPRVVVQRVIPEGPIVPDDASEVDTNATVLRRHAALHRLTRAVDTVIARRYVAQQKQKMLDDLEAVVGRLESQQEHLRSSTTRLGSSCRLLQGGPASRTTIAPACMGENMELVAAYNANAEAMSRLYEKHLRRLEAMMEQIRALAVA